MKRSYDPVKSVVVNRCDEKSGLRGMLRAPTLQYAQRLIDVADIVRLRFNDSFVHARPATATRQGPRLCQPPRPSNKRFRRLQARRPAPLAVLRVFSLQSNRRFNSPLPERNSWKTASFGSLFLVDGIGGGLVHRSFVQSQPRTDLRVFAEQSPIVLPCSDA